MAPRLGAWNGRDQIKTFGWDLSQEAKLCGRQLDTEFIKNPIAIKAKLISKDTHVQFLERFL